MNNTTAEIHPPACHNCGRPVARMAGGYEELYRVTSDCKPWPPGGRMGWCEACGLVQAVTDQVWQNESHQIYSQYEVYHQSGGIEQTVFNPATGQGRSRSAAIVEGLLARASLPETGRLLDIGCANGGFLREFSRAMTGWRFCGSEFDTRHRSVVEAIPGVEKLYSGPLEKIPGRFDVISLIHVLEHIPAPTTLLGSVRDKLNPGGWLVIEVPDCHVNPFMLLVADHASHFSPGSLSAAVARAGFEVLQANDAWVAKEISLLARKTGKPPDAKGCECSAAEAESTFRNWEFLQHIAAKAADLKFADAFGILGTSIAATWLDKQTGQGCVFFVDEDPHRPGRQHEGRRILSVADIPSGASVFVALPLPMATKVAGRLQSTRPDVNFVTP